MLILGHSGDLLYDSPKEPQREGAVLLGQFLSLFPQFLLVPADKEHRLSKTLKLLSGQEGPLLLQEEAEEFRSLFLPGGRVELVEMVVEEGNSFESGGVGESGGGLLGLLEAGVVGEKGRGGGGEGLLLGKISFAYEGHLYLLKTI